MTTITLQPMTEADYAAYLAVAVDDYAGEHVRAGNWSAEEASALARAQYDQYLPQGVQTPDHALFLFAAEGEPEPVGMGWIHVEERRGQRQAFIFDIRVYPAFQRRGYGAAALAALEAAARDRGATRIGLHVFGHNAPARALYEKSGYTVTDLWMAKPLA